MFSCEIRFGIDRISVQAFSKYEKDPLFTWISWRWTRSVWSQGLNMTYEFVLPLAQKAWREIHKQVVCLQIKILITNQALWKQHANHSFLFPSEFGWCYMQCFGIHGNFLALRSHYPFVNKTTWCHATQQTRPVLHVSTISPALSSCKMGIFSLNKHTSNLTLSHQ